MEKRLVSKTEGSLVQKETPQERRTETGLSTEWRERIRKKTHERIVSIILGGFLTLGVVAKAFSSREISEWMEKKPAATRVVKEREQEQLSLVEKVEIARIEDALRSVEEKIDSHDELIRLIRKVRERNDGDDRLWLTLMQHTPQFESHETRPDPVVEHFEQKGVDSKAILRMVKETYPPSWKHNIDSIRFSKRHERLGEKYGKKLSKERAAADASYDASSVEGSVRFFSGGVGTSAEVREIMGHELGHLVSWESNKALSLQDRLLFLQKILERVEAKDRFISEYVEDIKVADAQRERQVKAREYWAEIITTYLEHPPVENGTSQLPQKDVKLIEWLLQKTDPKFDARKAVKERRRIALRVASPGGERYRTHAEDDIIEVDTNL